MQARESTSNGLPVREWRWEARAALIPVSALLALVAVGATPFLGGDTHLPGVPRRAAAARAFAAANTVLRTIEVHQPDWVATVDGEPAPTLRVDHCFLGVVVPPGRHRARVRCEPGQLGLPLGHHGAAWFPVLAEAAAAALVCVRRRSGD